MIQRLLRFTDAKVVTCEKASKTTQPGAGRVVLELMCESLFNLNATGGRRHFFMFGCNQGENTVIK